MWAPREIAIFVPLIVATLVMGFYPAAVFDLTEESVRNLEAQYSAALEAHQSLSTASR